MQLPSEAPEVGGLPPVSVSAPQLLPRVADSSAQETEGSRAAGQPGQPKIADNALDVGAQTETAQQPGRALRETASQSDLAASVSASILTSTNALAPHTSDSLQQDTAEASAHALPGPVGSHASSAPGMAPAQDDFSRPLGQAEASKLIGIRDDLDQLGAAQPDVPCRGHKGSPAEVPEEAHPEQATTEGGTDVGVSQQEPVQQAAAEMPCKSSAEQPTSQGIPEGGKVQQAAERQNSLQQEAPTDTHHDTQSAAADSIADAPDLRTSQQSSRPTDSAPNPTAQDAQAAAPAAEVSMQAADHEQLSEANPASEPVAGQSTAAVLPPASTGTTQGTCPAADRLPERLPLPVSLAEGLDNGHMQQPSTPRLFDPTALLSKAQSPALNGLSEHSSPPRSDDIPAGEAFHHHSHGVAAALAAEHLTPGYIMCCNSQWCGVCLLLSACSKLSCRSVPHAQQDSVLILA